MDDIISLSQGLKYVEELKRLASTIENNEQLLYQLNDIEHCLAVEIIKYKHVMRQTTIDSFSILIK